MVLNDAWAAFCSFLTVLGGYCSHFAGFLMSLRSLFLRLFLVSRVSVCLRSISTRYNRRVESK